jgi:hypothetical protein
MASLEDRIAARLHRTLDHLEAAGFEAPAAKRALAVNGPDDPVIVMTVEDVARVAVSAARPEA